MNDKTLNVHMLGVFSIEYEDHPLLFERSAVSKTVQLLQMIFYNLDNGISKELLMDALYGRESVENRNGSLNNTIFRLRKQLEAAGLPKGRYVTIHNGIMKWEEQISVKIDVLSFKEKISESDQKIGEERIKCLMEACKLYKGEFLPNMIGEDWVAIENTKLQTLYVKALKEWELDGFKLDFIDSFILSGKSLEYDERRESE